jgi:hypothetical protein
MCEIFCPNYDEDDYCRYIKKSIYETGEVDFIECEKFEFSKDPITCNVCRKIFTNPQEKVPPIRNVREKIVKYHKEEGSWEDIFKPYLNDGEIFSLTHLMCDKCREFILHQDIKGRKCHICNKNVNPEFTDPHLDCWFLLRYKLNLNEKLTKDNFEYPHIYSEPKKMFAMLESEAILMYLCLINDRITIGELCLDFNSKAKTIRASLGLLRYNNLPIEFINDDVVQIKK